MQRRHLASLMGAFTFLALSAGVQAADKGWFGFAFSADADGWLHPVVKSITVTQVFPDSPAAHAGLAVGDSVVEVQGIAVAGGSASELQAALKKAAGETLRLKIRHGGGEPREVSMVAVAAPAQ